MKSSNLIFVITTALIVWGCSKDDSRDLTLDSSIVGEWKMTDVRVSGILSIPATFGTYDTDLYLDAINYNNYQANITGSPNVIAPSGSFGITVSALFWDLGESYSKDINDILVFNAGSWSADADTLLVSSGNETEPYRIIDINDASMTITKTINSEMDVYDEKTPFAIYLIISLSKI